MASAPNVLPLSDPPRQKSYRAAVARCIRNLKAKENLSNVELAEEIGCSGETISNAENENNDLNAVTLLRIAYRFGEEAISPIRDLYLRAYHEPKSMAERKAELLTNLQAIFDAEGRG